MTATAKPASLAGVVLAGGASLRTGRDRATRRVAAGHSASPASTTLVEHAVSILAQRCEPVIVVAAPGQPLPELPARVVRDDVRGVGPLLALARGLHAAAEAGAKRAFVSSVDVGFLTDELIEVLAARADEVDADVVLPWDGGDHYLAAVYRTELATQIDALVAAGERHLPALLDRVDTQRIVIADSRPAAAVKSAGGLRGLLHAGR
jgi:molybdenum cofactor guanylyltransferase